MGKLYIVATPIGNLKDITLRALEILKEVDLILCEDTRVTQKLLFHFSIRKKILAYHQHTKLNKIEEIIGLLKSGKNLALVSDAGTPGINDPGGKLIEEVVEQLSDEIKIIPIPGPNAIVAALSISGFPADEFLFMGFPPHKKGRQTFFENVIEEAQKRAVVFYESPHRIMKTLEQLNQLLKIKSCKLKIVLCRELTKKFETIYRGRIDEVFKKIKPEEIRGEFVLIIDKI